jgi:hypothetical protein
MGRALLGRVWGVTRNVDCIRDEIAAVDAVSDETIYEKAT